MFSYYGSKSKIVKKYPKPIYDLIIEPFAGSARYSLLYADKQVILNDSYKVIADIWEYLITATKEQIEQLPELNKGDDIRTLDLPQVEKKLVGFMINRGSVSPRNIYTNWAFRGNEIRRTKTRILNNLERIRHWKVYNKDYQELENIDATWFIDPPYQNGGIHYKKNIIDYQELAEWCKSRKGQIIVCENSKATWLNFKPLVKMYGQGHTTIESIYTNIPHNIQKELF